MVETSKKSAVTNKRVWDKTDHYLFCEKNVTNFTRHILRNYKDEIEVANFEAFPKDSVARKKQAEIKKTWKLFYSMWMEQIN